LFRSLRVRMAASHAAVLAVILILIGGVGYLALSRSLDDAATQQLLAAARDQVSRILEAGRPLAAPDTDVPSSDTVRIGVFDPGGHPIGEAPEYPSWLHPNQTTIEDGRVAGEDVRVITLPVRAGGTRIATVVAGRSLSAEERLLDRVRALLLVGGTIAMVASLLAGWWLAGRAIRPVQQAYAVQENFAADASHELRTPLTFVRSGVEVLAESDPGLGGQVLGEIDYLTGLTQRMLLLARAERGRLQLARIPFDLAYVCRSAARRSTEVSGNRLTLEGDGVQALGDPVATEAVLDAALENVAVHGGGEAVVRWSRDGRSAVVIVEDHGPGLSPELAARTLDRFVRADASRARETGGAGLGLAIAKTLMEAQGGTISLGVTGGGGLTARINLPA
jgi:signal transduction histidine kinase